MENIKEDLLREDKEVIKCVWAVWICVLAVTPEFRAMPIRK